MKRYRIIMRQPDRSWCIVDVKRRGDGYPTTGYTSLGTAMADLERIRDFYPNRGFELASYVELEC